MRQKKEFEHERIEICKITKKKIDTIIDDYAIIIDCRGSKIMSIGFYKNEDLKKLIKGNIDKISSDVMRKAQGITEGILEKMGMLKPVYQIGDKSQ